MRRAAALLCALQPQAGALQARGASALAHPSRASPPALQDVYASQGAPIQRLQNRANRKLRPPPPLLRPLNTWAVAPTLLTPREDPRLSYVAGLRHPPILNQTIGAALEQTAAALGEHEAVVAPQQGAAGRLSYRELLQQADEVARGLLALGVQVRNERV